ncbi:protein-glutamine gamma-glutamyltransferase [Duganella caerulea]|uniref:transglutaminase TgpA family protein n=1 Tax=Duganella caerulea TaxID=2885762 RepID=UPI0030E759D5
MTTAPPPEQQPGARVSGRDAGARSAPAHSPGSGSGVRASPGPSASPRTRLSLRLTRDKSDTLLLLAAALMVLAPHFEHLPPWIAAVVCATLLWRAAITWRGRRMPPLWLLLPVSLAAMAGVYRSFHTLLGRDAGVAMLTLLLAFKLLEMRAKRDLFVVIFLSFFVLLTNFLYSQTMPTALWMGATLIVLLTAQQSFQYTGTVPPLAQRLRKATSTALLATPLALLMFIGFPRIQGPLWGLPGDAHSGHTGISDSMAPGTLSSLAQSDAVAFRARFPSGAPAQSQLYWRSIVLGDYDGRTWTRVPRRRGLQRLEVNIATRGQPLHHEITMEPTNTRWLAALELSGPTLSLPGHRVRDSDELEFFTSDPVTQRLRYEADAWTDFTVQAAEQPQRMARWTELPAGYNPRTLALARRWRQTVAPGAEGPLTARQSAGAALQALQYFHEGGYAYTLQPPLLGHDAVDDFLFGSKAGFCEHYAGAFVVLLRAMGVPARVVTGYQGGELNPVDGYLTIRQSDAHAWAEYWAAGVGWRRVDPTAAVAPERIAHNLARALPQATGFGLAPLLNLQNDPNSWLSQIRFRYAALNNAWNQWVLDYNPDRQRGFLEELSSAFANWRGALGAALVCALLAVLRWLRRRRPLAPLDGLYERFCRQQARHGYARRPDEGPLGYAARLRTMRASPDKHAAMEKFLTLYGALKYGAAGSESRSASLTTLKTLLTLCR